MKEIANAIVRSPMAQALIVFVLVVPLSVYLGTSTVRRGLLYFLEAFAPAVVLGIAAGLWTWSWKWFWSALAISAALTLLTQFLVSMFWR
jgi:ABC-type Mn2+/Zn2+ transport system permease subunit